MVARNNTPKARRRRVGGDAVVSVAEAAQILGVTPSVVYYRIRRGMLPADALFCGEQKLSGYRIPLAAVLALQTLPAQQRAGRGGNKKRRASRRKAVRSNGRGEVR